MLDAIIAWALRRRAVALLLGLVVMAFGAAAALDLELDAFPDTTPVQVQANTPAPSLTAEEVERQITAPIEQVVSGLPHLVSVRSLSRAGLSQVTAVFADGTDFHFARRLLSERIANVELPLGLPRPELGPATTVIGEVLHYVVSGAGHDLTELRTVQDWVLRPILRTVPGVAEINSWGGFEKRVEVRADPERLALHGLTVTRLREAIEANNLAATAGNLEDAGQRLPVQGELRVHTLADIGAIPLADHDGAVLRVRDVAEVVVGRETRHGAATAGGRGEAVLGLGFVLRGENGYAVTSALKERIVEAQASLPEGVSLETVYDRTELVDHVIATVRGNLFEGGLLVIAVLFLFLGHLRAGLIVALAIPFSMLFAFSGMARFGIAGSLMSLGAIDFGLIVDSSVIQVENMLRRLSGKEAAERPHLEIVRDAAVEVRRPTLFGELIIVLVYVPILMLEGVEGKLFRPMALTVILALLGSLVFSLTLAPALASLLIRPRPGADHEQETWPVRAAAALYRPVLRLALAWKPAVIALALVIVGFAVMLARGLGVEFVPRLSEGAITLNLVRFPGADLSESVRLNTEIERTLLAAFPDEVRRTWSRTGTAEVATDAMAVEVTDLYLALWPRERWRKAGTQAELAELVRKELRDIPGQTIGVTQPMEMLINENVAQARSDVALQIYGDDLDVLARLGEEAAAVLHAVPGSADVAIDHVTGEPLLRVHVDRDAAARHGVRASEITDLITALDGLPAGELLEGEMRFPLVVSLAGGFRRDPARIGSLPLALPSGERVTLSQIARVELGEGPSTITRQWGRRRITVQCNVVGRDLGSFVGEARERMAGLQLPEGRYHLEWGGQFEHLERARTRLFLVVPIVMLLIMVLLQLSLGSWRLALLVFTGVPLAVTGGVAALWIRGMDFSISAAVGFIALSGVAVLNGLVLVTFIRQLREAGVERDRAVLEGSLTRLRPVLVTALVAGLGFVPMAFATGMGAEVQRPLATVVVGGLVSSTLLTLLVLPALYGWFEPRTAEAAAPSGDVP